MAYSGASLSFLAYLLGDTRLSFAGALAPRLVAMAVVAHVSHLVASSWMYRLCPVEGIHFAMSVVSLFACAIYLFMRRRYRIDAVGVFVAPLALTFILASRL